MTLITEKCVACRRDAPKVNDQEIAGLHPLVHDWDLLEIDSVKRLDRKFRVSNFAEAMNFAQSIGELAEVEGHHPRLVVEWGAVGVSWWTHKIKGLHRNDFIMAAKTDAIFDRMAQ